MLGLKTLERERISFELEDGRFIYFRTKVDFDLSEMAMMSELLQRAVQLKKQSDRVRSDSQRADIARKNRGWCIDMIHLVLPDLPDETINGLTAGQTDNLATLCRTVANGTYQVMTADEEQKVEIADQFPDLPIEFIATLTRSQAWLLIPPPEQEDEAAPN